MYQLQCTMGCIEILYELCMNCVYKHKSGSISNLHIFVLFSRPTWRAYTVTDVLLCMWAYPSLVSSVVLSMLPVLNFGSLFVFHVCLNTFGYPNSISISILPAPTFSVKVFLSSLYFRCTRFATLIRLAILLYNFDPILTPFLVTINAFAFLVFSFHSLLHCFLASSFS